MQLVFTSKGRCEKKGFILGSIYVIYKCDERIVQSVQFCVCVTKKERDGQRLYVYVGGWMVGCV